MTARAGTRFGISQMGVGEVLASLPLACFPFGILSVCLLW
jgi:hypothetical protein